ncbi:transcription-repair coupling factor [Haliovirga abyssi]|uniref:Transcription-repair-coupling factor n=1 Tax=Haliovirga abyssi TaxID=2996794 RepID=A0AAU9DS98_9FUSO|nr:transcription-repair coupling factor [Haliovirga abyssi]BDU51493.1 transcription-repair-coupling factor [Haliovirga abyssi]
MNFEINLTDEEIYRGAVPFYLKNEKRAIYISSTIKNRDDFYFVLKDIFKGKVLKLDMKYNNKKEKEINNQQLLKLINSKKKFIVFLDINQALDSFYKNYRSLKLEIEKEYSLKKILNLLEENGYVKNYLIEKHGEYSLRGDILDIFLFKEDNPIRIEFFGDNIESIRYFDINTQKSIKNIKKIEIFFDLDRENEYGLLDLIDKKNVKLYLENADLINYRVEEKILLERENEDKIREKLEELYNNSDKINLKSFKNSEINQYKDYDKVMEISKDKKVTILTEEDKRLKEIFKKHKSIKIIEYPYFEGFELEKEIILTDRELKGIKVRRVEKRKEGVRFTDINQLKKDDYLIHSMYGVGIYLGIESINNKDYVKIKYADEDKLYVPVEHIERIEKFITEPGKVPEIYKLGKKGFNKKREKLKKEIIEFAKDLITIQAKREASIGYSFSKDTIWQEEFEEAFPYVETEGQLKAIEDIKADMESSKSMDRVVCGDVGYGKTEVAMRAIFKCVMDGKQVAMLAPTTVLVHQHYERFKERYKNFPVEIEMLSRLEKTKEQKEILKKLKDGKIDIIIGTHRLIQNDVKFSDLGVLVIDEEQKFGVRVKEKLKKYKSNIDVLTLTATPIPRTLNLSLMGIKDISVIETPPENRIPIDTIFIDKKRDLIRDSVLKEIARDGQVFYVYNRVKDMKEKVTELEKILPKYVKIDYINGQMEPKDIRDKIEKFENEEFNILVTTTIIENGIDIENANTIIIENYDRLGLSQIYQLRGRVGRGSRKAFCYLLKDENRKSTKKGEKKILSLNELEDFGSGLKLSMEDMKIRGSGEIIGEKQHGIMEFLGYDMYLKMLEYEMKRIKNEDIIPIEKVTLEIKENGYIPENYIKEEEKYRVYKRMIRVNSIKELKELKNEIIDRFGKMPIEVENLFDYFEIKILCALKNIISIKELKNGFYLEVDKNKIDLDKLDVLLLDNKVKYLQKEEKLFLSKENNLKEVLHQL